MEAAAIGVPDDVDAVGGDGLGPGVFDPLGAGGGPVAVVGDIAADGDAVVEGVEGLVAGDEGRGGFGDEGEVEFVGWMAGVGWVEGDCWARGRVREMRAAERRVRVQRAVSFFMGVPCCNVKGVFAAVDRNECPTV